MLIVLIAAGAFSFLLFENIIEYLEYNVITEIREIHADKMTLPALTLCHRDSKTFNFGDYINKCRVTGANCTINSVDLIEAKTFGEKTGIYVKLINLPSDMRFLYFIGDSFVKPLVTELLPDINLRTYKQNFVPKLTVNEKLGYPYNQCQKDVKDINDFDSNYYRQIIGSGIKYRQANCIDLCEQDTSNSSLNCDSECPFECDSKIYDVNKIINAKASKSNSTIRFTVRYYSFWYTKITQIPKTSGAVLFSNIGGLAGLFLGISVTSFSGIIELLLNRDKIG